ncbi:MAG: hypothetical protein GKC53_06180 [Neisseriaceae bacterium]|nr:MAG: hypothetical protein GKC53_06180 [Neisseriaceae bacterium]
MRSNITMQITQTSSHLSSNCSIRGFYYAHSTLHTTQSLLNTRVPLKVWTQILRHQGRDTDIEVFKLMLDCVQIIPSHGIILSLDHIDIFNSLLKETNTKYQLFYLIKRLTIKDSQTTTKQLTPFQLPLNVRQSFVVFNSPLDDHQEVIENTKEEFIQTPRIQTTILELEKISIFVKNYLIYIDLSWIRSDHYHTRLSYRVYVNACSNFLEEDRCANLEHYSKKARSATVLHLDFKYFLNTIRDEKIDNNDIKIPVRDYEPAKEMTEELKNNQKTSYH